MELERMRELLATEAMGWTRTARSSYWKDDGGLHRQIIRDWHPDTDWAQCGLVIEALRAKGWAWHVIAYTDGSARVSLHHRGGRQVNVAEYERRPEREARMLAAARALEATDGES